MGLEWDPFFTITSTHNSTTSALHNLPIQCSLEPSTTLGEGWAASLSTNFDGANLYSSGLENSSTDAGEMCLFSDIPDNGSTVNMEFDQQTTFPTLYPSNFNGNDTNEHSSGYTTEAANCYDPNA